jgi:hypothetical protein
MMVCENVLQHISHIKAHFKCSQDTGRRKALLSSSDRGIHARRTLKRAEKFALRCSYRCHPGAVFQRLQQRRRQIGSVTPVAVLS